MAILSAMIRAALISIFLALSGAHAQTPASRVDAAFQKFWSADSPEDAERLVDDVLKSGVTFDEAYRRLKNGRIYSL